MFRSLIISFFAFIVTIIATYPVLWIGNFLKIGQTVREEGPATHQKKTGTPTMGGIGIFVAVMVFMLVLIDLDLEPRYLALLLLFSGFALIGFLDDLLKFFRGNNLGLKVSQKFGLQIIFALIFSYFLFQPVFYALFAALVIVGSANATNLTDGLDGLLAGTALLAFFALGTVARLWGFYTAEMVCFAALGACLAFLWFNFPKARMFMGDVGSLSLGALLAGLALIMHAEFLLLVIGGVFVVETLSVILQVFSFKLFGKRIFKMAPLHHHFEMLGWPEIKVVLIFWLAAFILAGIGMGLGYWSLT